MSHPIHQAHEYSPYGDLSRDQFYTKHHILHQESFILNKENMKIFTQSWRPKSAIQLKGVVAMVHGYTNDSSWLSELTAVFITKAGFIVCALDLQGHGRSDGLPGHIPNVEHVIRDCKQFFDLVKAANYRLKLPSFLYGESFGGAVSILMCLKHKYEWDGLILSGAMCGITARYKPPWPLQKLLPVAALFAPTWKPAVTRSATTSSKSYNYKEEWKGRLVGRNPNRRTSEKRPPAATALEIFRVCAYIRDHAHELEVPFLMVHGENDKLCEPESAKFVYESAASKDKTLKIFPGMWHMLIGETEENVELVFGTILSWIRERAAKTKRAVL